MKAFPMFLRMTGRRVVIVGGGEQAAQKCRLMLKTEAEIVIAAHDINDELTDLADQGRVLHHVKPVDKSLFENTALVFVANGDPDQDLVAYKIAKAAGALVNVVDQPELCDAITPSIVDRDPVVVAIGTEGTAPILARQIKTDIEQILEPNLGDLAALAGRLRKSVGHRFDAIQRRKFWGWVFRDAPRQTHRSGAQRAASKMITAAISDGKIEPNTKPIITFAGAGPGASDLITLRAVQRLQEADIIFYDEKIDHGVLELARRDAERVRVTDNNHWGARRVQRMIMTAASKGKFTVRLVQGNPVIDTTHQEIIHQLNAAGYSTETIPGVLDCSAALSKSDEKELKLFG